MFIELRLMVGEGKNIGEDTKFGSKLASVSMKYLL